jgi:predicted amidohydrolase YtcJ
VIEKSAPLLIRNAGLMFSDQRVDVRLSGGRIVAVWPVLTAGTGDTIIDARGAALLPGLHDHHIHLQALATAIDSITCDPLSAAAAVDFAARLRAAAATGTGTQWLRGIGYHESVAGEIDRDWLDACIDTRPVRIQHRSGRLWILNSRALEIIGADEQTTPLERRAGRATGRLYDGDDWLRQRMASQRPALATASRRLASYGTTGITDVTHTNSRADFDHFAQCQQRGELRQRVTMMGDASLDNAANSAMIITGATKIHLHEHALPEFGELRDQIARSHSVGRPVAVHCVTVAELAYTLAALSDAGVAVGDRIEHAAVVPDEWLAALRKARVTVVTQPNFIAERGDSYIADLPADEHAWLYRAQSLMTAGVPVAAGTDAPFGDANPWPAMQAAVTRRTAAGQLLGVAEMLAPEAACRLYLGMPTNPGRAPRTIAAGAVADLCLLDRSWVTARGALSAVKVDLCLRQGEIIWNSHQESGVNLQ